MFCLFVDKETNGENSYLKFTFVVNIIEPVVFGLWD